MARDPIIEIIDDEQPAPTNYGSAQPIDLTHSDTTSTNGSVEPTSHNFLFQSYLLLCTNLILFSYVFFVIVFGKHYSTHYFSLLTEIVIILAIAVFVAIETTSLVWRWMSYTYIATVAIAVYLTENDKKCAFQPDRSMLLEFSITAVVCLFILLYGYLTKRDVISLVDMFAWNYAFLLLALMISRVFIHCSKHCMQPFPVFMMNSYVAIAILRLPFLNHLTHLVLFDLLHSLFLSITVGSARVSDNLFKPSEADA